MNLLAVNVGTKHLGDYASIAARGLMDEIRALAEPLAGKRVLHLSATAFGGGVAGYSNWELSSDRANASRRELLTGGLGDAQVLRVQGLSASVPFDKDDPLNPVNRRISIIVMNRDAEDRFHQAAQAEAEALGAESLSAADSSPAAGAR